MTEIRDYWSEDGVFYHYGKAYGLTPGLRNVCLGTEAEILKHHPAPNRPIQRRLRRSKIDKDAKAKIEGQQ